MVRGLVAGGAGFIGSHLVDRLLVARSWPSSSSSTISGPVAGRASRTCPTQGLAATRGHRDRRGCRGASISPATPRWYMAEPLRTISANVVGGLRLLGVVREGGLFACASDGHGMPRAEAFFARKLLVA